MKFRKKLDYVVDRLSFNVVVHNGLYLLFLIVHVYIICIKYPKNLVYINNPFNKKK